MIHNFISKQPLTRHTKIIFNIIYFTVFTPVTFGIKKDRREKGL